MAKTPRPPKQPKQSRSPAPPRQDDVEVFELERVGIDPDLAEAIEQYAIDSGLRDEDYTSKQALESQRQEDQRALDKVVFKRNETVHDVTYPGTPNDAGYGAKGDGTTDDEPAVNLAIAALSVGDTLYFPRGTYKLSDNVTVPAGNACVFESGAKISIDTAKTFTVNGTLIADSHQIFDGAGIVDISGADIWEIDPVWFGNSIVTTFDVDDATPSVAFGRVFKTANANPTTITMLDDAIAGVRYTVLIGDGNTTIDFTGTNLHGNGASDWSPVADDSMDAVSDGTDIWCVVGNGAGVFREVDTFNLFGPDGSGRDAVTGSYNIAAGEGSLVAIRGGSYNVAVGYEALKDLTADSGNVGIGYLALGTLSNLFQSGDNVAVGHRAGYGMDDGNYNIFIGMEAGLNTAADINKTGDWNIGIGRYTLGNLNDGDRNIAIGYQAGEAVSTGDDNILIGTEAGEALNAGEFNIFIGRQAGHVLTSGVRNVGVGLTALFSATTATFNVAVGQQALHSVVAGTYNVALGPSALAEIVDGNNNSGLGHNAGSGIDNASDSDFNICIGVGAGPTGGGAAISNLLYIHNAGGTPTISADMSVPRVGINVDPTSLSNILEVQQTSATDPIADSWTTYPSDRSVKDEIPGEVSLLDDFRKIKVYRYRRKPILKEQEVNHAISQEIKKILTKVQGSNLFDTTAYGDFVDVEALRGDLQREKEALPKYIAERVGVFIDDTETPDEIVVKNSVGEITGIDILGYVGYLHAVLKELVDANST